MGFSSLEKKLTEITASYSPWPERILIFFSVLLAYSSVWPNEFVFDDVYLIVNNAFLRHWDDLPKLLTSLNFTGSGVQNQGFYRPIPMLLHFFVYQVFGPSTAAFHALNIALQAFNGCLFYRFGFRGGFKKGVAFAAALLWAVHPLHSEAVAYMSSTPELLWTTFCLLGLTAPLPDFTPRKIYQAIIFFILALGCKETAVVFPALAVATLFFVRKDRAHVSAYYRTWPLWAILAVYVVIWITYVHMTGYNMNGATNINGVEDPRFPAYSTSITNRFFTCLGTLPVYIGLMLWPHNLHMERAFPVFTTLFDWLPMTGALIVILCLAQIFWGRARQGLALSFGILWFTIAHSPTTGVLFPINALVSEHWMYLPMIGLLLGILETVSGLFKKMPIVAVSLVLIMALFLGTVTFSQSKNWQNPETLYYNIVDNGGNRYRISEHLAYYYMRHGEFDEAIEQFQYLTSHTFGRTVPWLTAMHMLTANAWLHARFDQNDIVTIDEINRALPASSHIAEAIQELGQALQLTPDFYWAHKYLAIIYRYQGNNVMADFHEKEMKKISQKNAN